MSSAIVSAPSCDGLRCLDRNVCLYYDDALKVARTMHQSDGCDVEAAMDATRLLYRDKSGQLKEISVDQAQELMRCTYTNKLLFQSTFMLRNYPFWGFTGAAADGHEHMALPPSECALISPHVAIGHVAALEGADDNALGLFAVQSISNGDYLGEYTGVVQEHAPTNLSSHDVYGISYPSVYEGGAVYISAFEFGNVIRCINHSSTPNTRFQPKILQGILHMYCHAIRDITAGEQIFVNYGPSYWKCADIAPISCDAADTNEQ